MLPDVAVYNTGMQAFHFIFFFIFQKRGSDILGLNGQKGSDGLPYTTLSYANGPGYYTVFSDEGSGARKDMSNLDFTNPELLYPGTAPLDSETHGGEDVGVYASGPQSRLFVGNYEQSSIPIAMAYAVQIGPYSDERPNNCTNSNVTGNGNGSGSMNASAIIVFMIAMATYYY